MAYRELSVVEVQEVLRLWRSGYGFRKVARIVGIDRKTVRRYVDEAEKFGLSREEGARTVDGGLVAEVVVALQPGPTEEAGAMRLLCREHKKRIEEWLHAGCKGPKIVRLLHQFTGVPVPLRTLQRFIREEIEPRRDDDDTWRMVDSRPGEILEVDFATLGQAVLDGRLRKVSILLCVARRSRHLFVWPCLGQTLEDVLEGLEAAWAFFGGMFAVIVPDNMKSVVAQADDLNPVITEGFLEYAQARDLVVDPTRKRHPKDKPRVERMVSYVRNDFFKGEGFTGLDDMRRRAAAWCHTIAGLRTHRTTRRQPSELFRLEELPLLKPPPTEPYDQPRWVDLRVGRDHAVTVAQALYSVPHRIRNTTLRVRYDRNLVKFYERGVLVKVHPRMPAGAVRIDPVDLPPGVAEIATQDAESLRQQALRVGPAVGEYVRRILDGPHPWSRFRHVYRLMGLCRRYGGSTADLACQRALDLDVVDVTRIDRMLARNVLGSPPPAPPAEARKVLALRYARDPSEFRTRPGGPDAG